MAADYFDHQRTHCVRPLQRTSAHPPANSRHKNVERATTNHRVEWPLMFLISCLYVFLRLSYDLICAAFSHSRITSSVEFGYLTFSTGHTSFVRTLRGHQPLGKGICPTSRMTICTYPVFAIGLIKAYIHTGLKAVILCVRRPNPIHGHIMYCQ